MRGNALAENNIQLFVKGVKIVCSRKNPKGSIGFMLLGDNYDEYEIPFLPGFEIVYHFVLGEEKVFIKNTLENQIHTFKSYLSQFYTENKYTRQLKEDPYWESSFYTNDGKYSLSEGICWIRVLLETEPEGFGNSQDVAVLERRERIFHIVQ